MYHLIVVAHLAVLKDLRTSEAPGGGRGVPSEAQGVVILTVSGGAALVPRRLGLCFRGGRLSSHRALMRPYLCASLLNYPKK